jgi:hypothetical protein
VPWLPKVPYPVVSTSRSTIAAAATDLASFFEAGKGRTLVITGAGVSTDSGIRAYRGERGVSLRVLVRCQFALSGGKITYANKDVHDQQRLP